MFQIKDFSRGLFYLVEKLKSPNLQNLHFQKLSFGNKIMMQNDNYLMRQMKREIEEIYFAVIDVNRLGKN